MLRNLSVILVRPRFPENIGMVARAMANMAVPELVLVAPERWDYAKALPLATEQGRAALDGMRMTESLEEALRPFTAAFGTTARTGGYRRTVLLPDQAAAAARSVAREGGRVALVFGSEDRGLENAEIALCTHLLTVPTAAGQSSLNLAQAVLLVLYECARADRALPFSPTGGRRWTLPARREDSRRATLEEEQLLFRSLEETLIAVGHLPEKNSHWFMRPLRRFLRKSRLRRHEFDMLMGISRQVRRCVPLLKESSRKTE